MSSTKFKIQKELFDMSNDKILLLINVIKIGRRRKNEQLCITVSQKITQNVCIHRITHSEKERLRCKNSWPLDQLRVIDGKERLNTNNTLEFELHFERIFKWSALHPGDKNNFLSGLYTIVCRYTLKNKIEIRNLDVTRLKKELSAINDRSSDSYTIMEDQELNLIDLNENAQDDYQELTNKEEQDLKRLFSQTTWAISDSEAFTGQLALQLSRLDQLNIETIMRSEEQIINLMFVLDTAVSELESMSDHLFECETLLQYARDSIEVVQLRDTNLDVEERNSKLLYKDLQLLVSELDLDSDIKDALLHQPLTGDCLDICNTQAFQLLNCINKEFDSGTAMMRSVIDQKQFMNTLKESFVARLYRHLVSEFKEENRTKDEFGLANSSEYLTLPSHKTIHSKLSQYSNLTFWLKLAEPDRLNDLKKDYLATIGPLYQEEFRLFFHELKKGAQKGLDKSKIPLKRTGSRAIHSGSNLELPELYSMKSNSIGHLTRSDSVSSNISNISGDASVSSSLEDSDRFEHTFSIILSQFQCICHQEQKFLDNLFHFNSEDRKIQDFSEKSQSPVQDLNSNSIEVGQNMNQELKICLTRLFDTLQLELEGYFHRISDTGSPFYILYVLQYIYSRVKPKSIDPSSMNYLDICLSNCLPYLQNYFDKYIILFKKHIEDTKNQKRTKDSGILNCVRKYVAFLVNTKAIMIKFDYINIGHIERYYLSLMESVSKTIDKASFDLNKTRGDVCRFENYQYLFSKLSELKIKCLEGCKEDSKKKSREFVEEYTKSMLGRPLEKLSFFFEGVENQLKKGTKPEEIGFISEFHKSELRKCASLYPGRDVRRCLETIYKKVDKHLSPELGMNQVVWHQMQTQLLGQFKNITDLIDRCYADANIKLDFTLGDLCDFFSDIQK